MADKISAFATNKNTTDEMGQVVDGLMETAKSTRRGFERRWYDNNFFDDGFHFRYLSRQANKIVDPVNNPNLPMRAVPKASRQLRGVANLLAGQDPIPVVYPEKVSKANFPDIPQTDPATGQTVMTPNPEYQMALDVSKQLAKKSGHWLQEEFKEQDLLTKLSLMIILAGKHGVSYMQIWPDAVEEVIKTEVLDAFDIWLLGDMGELKDSPFVIKTKKQYISQIKANEMFDPVQVQKIHPDNKHASSEIKDAYMSARFGKGVQADQVASINLRETFIKEYINQDNEMRIRMQEDADKVLRGKKQGDVVIRQVFSVGNIWLKDKYIAMSDYPIVDFRFEPGPIYQVPLIERFIPQNKSYDMILSRLEQILHSMTVGTWLVQDGTDFKITNQAGGQILRYTGLRPEPGNMAQVPAWVFNVLGIMQSNMEEQGVTTSALGRLPSGVKANAAIESLKESEIANLAIPTRMFRRTVKRIAEKFLDIADDYFVKPQEVQLLERGEPQYFDVIGKRAYDMRQEVGMDTQDLVPLNKYCKVDIQIESQLAYTQEGKKAAAKELGDMLVNLSELGVVPPKAVSVFWEQVLKAYQFGPTEEVMDAMDEFIESGGAQNVDNETLDKMKLAMLQVIADAKQAGVFDQPPQPEKPLEIPYKDAPEDVKREMEQKAGFEPSKMMSPAGTEQVVSEVEAEAKVKQANKPVPKGGAKK